MGRSLRTLLRFKWLAAEGATISRPRQKFPGGKNAPHKIFSLLFCKKDPSVSFLEEFPVRGSLTGCPLTLVFSLELRDTVWLFGV